MWAHVFASLGGGGPGCGGLQVNLGCTTLARVGATLPSPPPPPPEQCSDANKAPSPVGDSETRDCGLTGHLVGLPTGRCCQKRRRNKTLPASCGQMTHLQRAPNTLVAGIAEGYYDLS